MGRGLHRGPHVGVRQYRNVIVDAHAEDLRVRPVGAEVGEGEPDRPDEREDVDRQ